jgi:serine/threonine protein phosphatase 1
MTYIIGDVHGEYGSLLQLTNKLPSDAKLIFVGDLVDRGRKSKEVIEFVRKNNHKCVLGNHEKMMIDYVNSFKKTYPNLPSIMYWHRWINNGGKQTLLSYEIIEIDKYDGKLVCTEDEEKFNQLLNDVKWLESLPLHLKLEQTKDDKPIVISHAPMANVWHFRDDMNNQSIFEEYALWNRINPNEDVEIFNIFGHTIQKEVDLTKHYINVDTGCCYTEEGYGKLSAYCIEENSVISV